MAENKRKNNIWMQQNLLILTLVALELSFGTGQSLGNYQNDEPLGYDSNFAASSNQEEQRDYGYLDKLFDVDHPPLEVSKKDGVTGKEFFPLLMPKVHPPASESYLCTPIEIKDDEYYITGNFNILLGFHCLFQFSSY